MKRLGLFSFLAAVIALILFAVWKIQEMSPRHHFELGEKAAKERRYDEAIARFTKVIQLDSRFPYVYDWRGCCQFARKEWDQALADFNRAIELKPSFGSTYRTRGEIYAEKGDDERAIADFNKAIQLDPKDGNAFFHRGLSYWHLSNLDSALADYNKTIEINPTKAVAFLTRGNVFLEMKDYDRAVADFDKALELDPGMVDALIDRGRTLRRKKDFARAEADFRVAVQQAPQNRRAYNNLAWLRATCPDAKFRDGAKAVEYATKAKDLTTWDDPFVFDTLAAAYAEVGNFDEAVKWLKKALGHPEDYAPEELEKDRKAMKSYEARKPYREE